MQKTSILSLSVVALLGLSTVAHGDWTWYSKDYKTSRPAEHIPNGDCLEMMCENGCVENNEYEGWCCPNAGNTGDSCTVAEGIDANACCQSGMCNKGKCVECITDAHCDNRSDGKFQCISGSCSCPTGNFKKAYYDHIYTGNGASHTFIRRFGGYQCNFDIYALGSADDAIALYQTNGSQVCRSDFVYGAHCIPNVKIFRLNAGKYIDVHFVNRWNVMSAWSGYLILRPVSGSEPQNCGRGYPTSDYSKCRINQF